MSARKILSASQAALILGVNPTTLARWVKSEIAPPPEFTAKAGDFWLEETIEAFAAQREEAA